MALFYPLSIAFWGEIKDSVTVTVESTPSPTAISIACILIDIRKKEQENGKQAGLVDMRCRDQEFCFSALAGNRSVFIVPWRGRYINTDIPGLGGACDKRHNIGMTTGHRHHSLMKTMPN